MSQFGRNRMKKKDHKKPSKNDITIKDKVLAILAIAVLIILAAVLAVYAAFGTAR